MGQRQREWARRTRDELRTTLGGKCQKCGSTEDLEFDVIIPVDQPHHRIEWSQRMTFYKRQFERNNLGLKCSHCNSAKGDDLELNPLPLPPEIPF